MNAKDAAAGPFDAAAQLSALSREDLVRIIQDDAKNWLAHDGLWFQAVEKAHGMDAAIEADRDAWEKFTVVEARPIMERLGMKPGGGIPALVEALTHRLYSRLNVQEVTELSATRAVFVMRDCRVQSARQRKGLPDFPCKAVGIVEYSEFARAIDPEDPDTLHHLPPDPHGAEFFCAWEFTLDDTDPKLADGIARATAVRYGALSTTKESLSCGRALDVAAPFAGEDVVDLGCGRGGDVGRAAGRVGPAGSATGVDASERMLAAAAEALAGLPNAHVVRSNLSAVALPDCSADVVVSNCAINHAPDKGAVYREVHRILRPGGRFAVSDVVSEEPLPESVRANPAAWAACYGGSIPEADYLSAISAAGLGDVEVVRRTEPYVKGGVRIRSITVTGRRPGLERP